MDPNSIINQAQTVDLDWNLQRVSDLTEHGTGPKY